MEGLAEALEEQRQEIRTESRLQRQSIESQWRTPLVERVQASRALGPLRLREATPQGLVHFDPPREDIASFREHDTLRLSQDDPEGVYHEVTFLGLTSGGLTVYCEQGARLIRAGAADWTLDEDFLDLSSFYFDAMDELGSSAHGRDQIAPILFEEHEPRLDLKIYDESAESLEPSELDESQADAVAVALASSPFHLIQGPPGTGKTHALARLVEQLLQREHRILVTAFTHRAINNALAKIASLVGGRYPVVKIARLIPGEEQPFPVYESYHESGLEEQGGPWVIGATPFAPWTRRLKGIRFDSVVLDEASQLTVPAAVMAMLPGDRWFFFGDHKQLPPVSHMHRDDPAAASVFSRLARNAKPSTLNISYRLNTPLTQWPSENFYGGELFAHPQNAGHRLALKAPAGRYPVILTGDPSLVRVELEHRGRRSRSDKEADLAADLLADLFDAGLSPSSAGVVVPFRSQASAIRTLLRGDRFSSHPEATGTVVDTVDRFQGQEREVVLYSFAASDPDFIARIANFLFQPPRLNVAVTRARTKVILIHSAVLREFAEAQAPYFEPAHLFLSLLNAAERRAP